MPDTDHVRDHERRRAADPKLPKKVGGSGVHGRFAFSPSAVAPFTLIQGRRTRYSGVDVGDSRWTLTKRRRTSLRIPACTALFDKTGGAGDHLMTQTRALRAAAGSLAPEVQVHQIRRGGMIVTHQVAHQHIEYVIVDPAHYIFKCYSRRKQIANAGVVA